MSKVFDTKGFNSHPKAKGGDLYDLSKLDLEYLVQQYELLQELYASPESLGKEKMDKIRKIFALFDNDGNGHISADEAIEMALKHWQTLGFNKKPSVEEALELFRDMDTDSNNQITFEEFTIYLIKVMKMKYIKPLTEYFVSLGLKVDC